MATLNNTSTTTTLVGSQNLVYGGSGLNWDTSISVSSDMTDFFELVLAALGYDITYDDFKIMSKEQRNQLIRDIKLKTIL
jgi:hypothetical protein